MAEVNILIKAEKLSWLMPCTGLIRLSSIFDSIMENLSKIELRRLLLKKRCALPEEEWKEKSDRLCQNLNNELLFQQANVILSYFSFRQEPNLSALLIDFSKQWGFPRCVEQTLIWHHWQPEDPIQINRYGIIEPDANLPILDASKVDLILVPAVACDSRGYRLGYGGGFYDRMFSLPEWFSIPTIGIIFDFAYFPELPIDSWDQPLTQVCTESRFINSFKSS